MGTIWERVKALITRQPIVTLGASITALVVAGIGVVNAFNPGTVSEGQVADITKALMGMWAALAAVWSLVTPTRAPRIPEGTSVEVVTPAGQPNKSVTL